MNLNSSIEVIARALILHDKRILLCKDKAKTNWYVPGGHIEKGETIEQGLVRELREETGKKLSHLSFIKYEENFFSDAHGEHHEILFMFQGVLEDPMRVESQEDHLTFQWIPFSELESLQLLPKQMKKEIQKFIS